MEKVLNKDFAMELLRVMLQNGGDFAEVYLQSSRNLTISLDDRKIEDIISGLNEGVGLRLIKGDNTYYASSNDLKKESLLKMADNLQRYINESNKAYIKGFDDKPLLNNCPIKIKPQEVSIDKKIHLLRDCETAARDFDCRITQYAGIYRESFGDVEIFNSEGTHTKEERCYITLYNGATAKDGGEMGTGSKVLSAYSGFELLMDESPIKDAREASRIAIHQLDAAEVSAGTFTVVLSGKAGGTMIHESIGHGLEGDFNAISIGVYSGKIGQRVASDCITVVDDGTLSNLRGSGDYDDEGTKTSKVVLIENGILKAYLCDRKNGRLLDINLTGNGRRESYRHIPIPRMRNTILLAGDKKPEDIISSVKDGIYVADIGGGQVDIVTGDFMFNVREAYRIRNGKIKDPLKGVTLIGNGPKVLSKIDLVGNDLGFTSGTCGKDGQGVPVTSGMPTVRIPEIVVGGKAKAVK